MFLCECFLEFLHHISKLLFEVSAGENLQRCGFIEDFSLEELRAKFETMKSNGNTEPAGAEGSQENFELEGQFMQELFTALYAEGFELAQSGQLLIVCRGLLSRFLELLLHTVIRTDLMSGTKQPADLVSLRFYDAEGKTAEVENGVIVKLEGYEDGEREVMKAPVPPAAILPLAPMPTVSPFLGTVLPTKPSEGRRRHRWRRPERVRHRGRCRGHVR